MAQPGAAVREVDVDEDLQEPLPPGIVRALRADPDHAPELLMRYAVERLSGTATAWAADAGREHPDRSPAEFAARLRSQTALDSRVQGAIAGTPFLLALVPAYVAVLWDQAWMTLRIAALYGRDLQAPGLAAELLVLRGVHPTLEVSQAALDALGPKPRKRLRGGLRSLYHLGERIMVLAGFLDPPDEGEPASWPKRAALFLFGCVLYVATWVIPLSFMVVMSHSCEVSTKRMADRAVGFYRPAGGPDATAIPLQRRHRVRTAGIALVAAGVPLGVIAFANHQLQSDETNWVRLVGSVLGLSLVLGLVALARRPAR